MSNQEAYENTVDSLNQNPIADLCAVGTTGSISSTPRTLQGIFPGSRTRAMGHALAAVDIVEDCGEQGEHEYVERICEELDAHRIDIHINGGSDENVERIDTSFYDDIRESNQE